MTWTRLLRLGKFITLDSLDHHQLIQWSSQLVVTFTTGNFLDVPGVRTFEPWALHLSEVKQQALSPLALLLTNWIRFCKIHPFGARLTWLETCLRQHQWHFPNWNCNGIGHCTWYPLSIHLCKPNNHNDTRLPWLPWLHLDLTCAMLCLRRPCAGSKCYRWICRKVSMPFQRQWGWPRQHRQRPTFSKGDEDTLSRSCSNPFYIPYRGCRAAEFACGKGLAFQSQALMQDRVSWFQLHKLWWGLFSCSFELCRLSQVSPPLTDSACQISNHFFFWTRRWFWQLVGPPGAGRLGVA